jgi:N-acetylmuramoyl-L-alanine amidase
VDPGHGGTTQAGRSTPFGVRGPNGVLEKDVTLQIARRVAQHLGGNVSLTRNGDRNVSLAERARMSRDAGAPLFLSIHANGGIPGRRGVETWVHPHAGHESSALADDVRAELGRLGSPDRGRRQGEIAVLGPSLHHPRAGACLVEVDNLDDLDGARRLSNPRELDAIAGGIARAVDRFLGRGAGGEGGTTYSFGRAQPRILDAADPALDLTDFDETGYSIVPDGTANRVPNNVTQAELDQLKKSWDAMMKGKGIKLQGSAKNQSTFRVMLHGQMRLSQVVRDQFLALTGDPAHTVTFDLIRNGKGVIVDAFRTEASNSTATPGLSLGFHTIDLNDFEHVPQVSSADRNFKYLQGSILVHALKEAREGAIDARADAFGDAHRAAIAEENRFRVEQGQVGTKPDPDPPSTVTLTEAQVHWQFFTGKKLAESEMWHIGITVNPPPERPFLELTSIDYDPLP